MLACPRKTGKEKTLQNKEATEEQREIQERADEQKKITQINGGKRITRTSKIRLKIGDVPEQKQKDIT